jgi:hypothetical protein
MEEAMKKSARIALPVVLALAAAHLPVHAADKAPPPPVKAEAAGVSFELAFIGEEVEITLKAKTTGWIAFGLDPTRRMNGADFVLGYVKDGKAFAEDHFGNGDFSHRPDVSLGGTNDVISAKGSEDSGVTTLTVRLPLTSKDEKDKKFTPGKHKLLLSYALKDDLSAKHASRGSVEIEIPAP